MASVYKCKGSKNWRAVIRIDGYPPVCKTFERKQEADDWVKETERRIKFGQFNFSSHNKRHTYADLLSRMDIDGALSHHRSLKNCSSQFNYWKERFGAYALMCITPELIAQERKILIDSDRSPATQFATSSAAKGASNIELATAMGHRTLSMLLRYSNLDAKSSKKFSDHIATKILQGSTHE